MSQPVVVDIVAPETAMISVDINNQYIGAVSGDVSLDTSLGVDVVSVSAASSYGGISLDLVYGGIKGDKGEPGGSFITRVA